MIQIVTSPSVDIMEHFEKIQKMSLQRRCRFLYRLWRGVQIIARFQLKFILKPIWKFQLFIQKQKKTLKVSETDLAKPKALSTLCLSKKNINIKIKKAIKTQQQLTEQKPLIPTFNLQNYSGWSSQIDMNKNRMQKSEINPKFFKSGDWQNSVYKQTPLTCYSQGYIKKNIIFNKIYFQRCQQLKKKKIFSIQKFLKSYSSKKGHQLLESTNAKAPFCKICSTFYDRATKHLTFVDYQLMIYRQSNQVTLNAEEKALFYIDEMLCILTNEIANAPLCQSIKRAMNFSTYDLIKELGQFYMNDPILRINNLELQDQGMQEHQENGIDENDDRTQLEYQQLLSFGRTTR